MDDPRGSVTSEVASATGAAMGLGGAATVAAVSACCAGPALGPLVVSLLGASGAVALEGLRPYSAPLMVASGLTIGASLWLNARHGRCAPNRRAAFLRLASRTVVWASGIVWLGAVVAVVWAASPPNSDSMRFTALNSADEPFRAAFNRQRDRVRVVELVSPTCPFCLDGVSKIQHELFANEPSTNLIGFAIWVPMLEGKAANVPEAMALAPDPRMAHYWDGSNDLGIAYERVLPVSSGPAWDVYMLYAPGIVWSGADPPKPSFWMHQLAITNAPHLDAAVFAARARALLARVRAR